METIMTTAIINTNNDIWIQAQKGLRTALGDNTFSTWIAPLVFANDNTALKSHTAHFHAPTQFVSTWVTAHYSDTIIRHLTAAGLACDRVLISVNKTLQQAAMPPSPIAADTNANIDTPPLATTAVHNTTANAVDISKIALNPKMSFDRFVIGDSNELAATAARQIAENTHGMYNSLFIQGNIGLGKTHLLQAIAWHIKTTAPKTNLAYLSAEQFTTHFVRALSGRNVLGFKDSVRAVDVLVLDDIQFIAGKKSTQDEFLYTFDALLEQQKRVVVSGDRLPNVIDGLLPRLKSRLQSGLVVDVRPPGRALRVRILQSKLTEHQIDSEIIDYIAESITGNVRDLEGAVNRLLTFSMLKNGAKLTLATARDCLSDLVHMTKHSFTIQDIQKAVADYYHVSVADLLSPRRHRPIARPRQVAMYLAKHLTEESLPGIGRAFGGRDHTTVLYAVSKIDALKREQVHLNADIDQIKHNLTM